MNKQNLLFSSMFAVIISLIFITTAEGNLTPNLRPNIMTVDGTKVLKNGQEYEFKDIGYGGLRHFEFFGYPWGICFCDPNEPFEPFDCPGIPGSFDVDPERQAYDMNLVKNAVGANGIRTWEPPNQSLLDAALANDLMITLGISLPWTDEYNDPQFRQNLIDDIIENQIKRLKDHPTTAMYLMGNEVEINIPADIIPHYFQFLLELGTAIHAEDPNHPISTAIAYNPGLISTYDASFGSLPFVWSVNVYCGVTFNPQGYPSCFDNLEQAMGERPYYISEYGIDAFHHTDLHGDFNAGSEDETLHAQVNANLAQEIRDEVKDNYTGNNPNAKAVGGAYFQFNDQTWQVHGWWDACYYGLGQDGWRTPGPDDYGDIEYVGAYRNTATQQNPNELTPRALVAELDNVFNP